MTAAMRAVPVQRIAVLVKRFPRLSETFILNEVLEDLDIEMLGSGTANETAVRHQAECEGSVDPAQLLA